MGDRGLERILDRRFREREYRARATTAHKEEVAVYDMPDKAEGIDFWCVGCGKDFTAEGVKRIYQTFAWHVGVCPCGARCVRRITDKVNDLYYRRSRKVRFDVRRGEYDFMTPDNPLFKIIYGRGKED